jgi:hypothetical protein
MSSQVLIGAHVFQSAGLYPLSISEHEKVAFYISNPLAHVAVFFFPWFDPNSASPL